MKLYYAKGACSFAIRITLYELGIPCEFESVNLKTKKTEKGEDFLKINEKGAVPTLVLESGEILTEGAIIQQYLADYHKATHLLPEAGNFRRYKILEWLNFIATELHKGFSPLFSQELSEEIKENYFRPVLKRKLEYVDSKLKQNSYLLGEAFTIADSYLFTILRWSAACKVDITGLANLSRYFKDLYQRSSIQRALNDENLNG